MSKVIEMVERRLERSVAQDFRPKVAHLCDFCIPCFLPRKSDEHMVLAGLCCNFEGCDRMIVLDFYPVAA